jgi:1,4-alpha-glucan branching enzyme
MAPKGYLMLTLHAHLPFARHPEHERFLEENWLFEAVVETYIPLIEMFSALVRDGVDFRLAMSLTPPLCNMLADELLQERCAAYLRRSRDLAEKEVERTADDPDINKLAHMYVEEFQRAMDVFDGCGRNLLTEFKRYQDLGKLEIVTCGATHGFAPLLRVHPEAVRAQIQIARASHEKHFGRSPRGIWNGECGYYPGLEDYLKEAGIRFFFVDSHGILYADKRPKYGVFAPLYCPNGVAAFGRDAQSSRSVWSADSGYPGNPVYRDFYRDAGFDADLEYIRPYIHPDGIRHSTGIKYYRVTGRGVDLADKKVYDYERARQQAAWDASDFLENRLRQAAALSELMDRPPLIVSPYDAELFGHWWREGPMFLEFLFRKIHFDQDLIETITPSEYLDRHRSIRLPARALAPGATRATARSGSTTPTTGFIRTCTSAPNG